MGVLTFTFRLSSLRQWKSDIDYKLMRITKKMQDLTSYSATISGAQTFSDLLKVPGVEMNRMMQYWGTANGIAANHIQRNLEPMFNMYMAQTGNRQTPEQQMQTRAWIVESLREQARDRAVQIETKNLKVVEDKLKQEKDKLETLQKEIAAEIEAVQKARDESIKEMAPKYTANA